MSNQDPRNQSTTDDAICLEIIIPTFQRADVLIQNLKSVANLIRKEALGHVSVRIRDNASTDSTAAQVRGFMESNDDLPITFHVNEQNIGLEPNCLALLEEATTDHIMFLGDDDFLPEGYLQMVVKQITEHPETGAIVSGFSALMPTGEIRPARYESYDRMDFEPGDAAMYRMMPLGHQLSGLVFKTESLAEDYKSYPDDRNLYPFIHFVGNRCRKYPSVYIPSFQLKVTYSAKKYWEYDRSALLRHVLSNYAAVFDGEPLKRARGQMRFMKSNWGRIGGANLLRLPSAFTHVVFWSRLDWLTRIALIACLPFIVVRSTWYSAASLVKRIPFPSPDRSQAVKATH